MCPNVIVVHSGRRRTNLSVMGSVCPDNKKKDNCVAQLEAGMQIPSLFFAFSFRRVQISGSVEDYPVPVSTVDTATDVSVVSHAWLMSHPTLRSVTIQPLPPTVVALRAEWFAVEYVGVCCIFTHPRYDYARCRIVSCTIPWSLFNTP